MAVSLVKRVGSKIRSYFQKPKKRSVYTKDRIKTDHIIVGDYSYGLPAIIEFGEGKKVYIGKFCSIGSFVQIFLGGNHRVDWVTTYPFNILSEEFPNAREITGHPVSKGDVIIGNDVWIGQGAVIMSGVTIGDGAVIGAYSVVAKDVEPYEIVVGNPMQRVKKRFDDNTIQGLLKMAWWNWDIEKINNNVHLLLSDNLKELFKKEGFDQ